MCYVGCKVCVDGLCFVWLRLNLFRMCMMYWLVVDVLWWLLYCCIDGFVVWFVCFLGVLLCGIFLL